MNETSVGEPVSADRSTARVVREFAFPRRAVFEMFTDPKKAARWFGTPTGAIPVLFELEARAGGRLRIQNRWPGQPVHETTGTVLEVVEPIRIAFRTRTALEEGAVPFEAVQTVTLEEVSPRRTRVVVVVKVLSAGSVPGGVASLLEGFQGGWGETLEKLQRELRSAAP